MLSVSKPFGPENACCSSPGKINRNRNRRNSYHKAYIAGCGLAGLAVALYLVEDAGMDPRSVTLFEGERFDGGSLDAVATGTEQQHYFMRGFRMLESNVYSAFFDFIAKIPLTEHSDQSLLDDFLAFNREVKTFSQSRLVEAGKAINARQFTLKLLDRIKILLLLTKNETELERVTIRDYFSDDFFTSNFWLQFSTTFSFQAWHSLEEFKRYILRFIQCSPVLDSQTCIRSTRYNQYDSVVRPARRYLQKLGVNFVYGAQVTNAHFVRRGDKLQISALEIENGKERGAEREKESRGGEVEEKRGEREKGTGSVHAGTLTWPVTDNDLVFLTLGSMTTMYSTGSMDTPPPPSPPPTTPSNRRYPGDWQLWHNIAGISPEFGNPAVFASDVSATRWVSFTVTFSDSLFLELLETLTGTKAGQEGPVTIKDSNWLISFALPNHPHFIGQPENLQILWGYGMHSDRPGNFVKKTLPECTGQEILVELIHHLKFDRHLDRIIAGATCIPCMLPYITSQFMPRSNRDRPAVKPDCAGNFAFIGQYCEIPDDIVFTLEYSVRSAQVAVYSYLDQPGKITPVYRGWRRLKHIVDACRTVFR